MRQLLSDKRICELPRRELEGKDEECKHGSHQRQHYFLSDLLLFLAPLRSKYRFIIDIFLTYKSILMLSRTVRIY